MHGFSSNCQDMVNPRKFRAVGLWGYLTTVAMTTLLIFWVLNFVAVPQHKSVHKSKQNGRHSQLFKNHQYVLKSEILQLASTDLHKMYMARKACLRVILALFRKQNGCHDTSFFFI